MESSTKIYWDIAETLRLTATEYCVADIIYNYAFRNKGYCDVAKNVISAILSLNPRAIFLILNTLKRKNIIEKQKGSPKVKITEIWEEVFIDVLGIQPPGS